METTLVVATALTALGTVALAVATIYLAYKTGNMVEANRDTVDANREMVAEMKASRIAQDRPHMIVDADYSHRDVISVVVRNIGAGAAKNISFEFSAPLESTLNDPKDSSKRFVVSELPFLREGLDYLAPGTEISSGWDTYIDLLGELADKGFGEGIAVTSHYQDLSGRSYSTSWKINPLKVEGAMDFRGPDDKALRDLVKAVQDISKKLPKQ